MKQKSLKSSIKKGELTLGMYSCSQSPAMIEILGYTGFDFVIIDTEHISLGFENHIENLVRAANASGIVPLIRVNESQPKKIMTAFDIGAQGVIIPHIKTKEEMKKVAQAAKYKPEGNRGATDYSRAAKYGAKDWSSYWQDANKESIVIPLIEDQEGVGNIEEILSVKGIDAVGIGAFDLSMDLGFAGNYTSEVAESNDRVVSLCMEKGIPIVGHASDADSAKEAIEKGERIIVFEDETAIFCHLCQNIIEKLKPYKK